MGAIDKESVAMLQVIACPDPTCQAPARIVDELASGPQPGQGQGWVAAAGDDDVQPRRKMTQEERHAVVDRPRPHQVVVVQHQRELIGRGLEVVDQRGHDALARHHPRRSQERQQVLPKASANTIERDDHIPPEPHRIVVFGVQRQPRHRPPRAGGPAGHQGGLAEAGGRAHKEQLPGHPLVEPFGQTRPAEEFAGSRDVELGGQEVSSLTACGGVRGRGG
jgi:hypothetical protein